MKQPAHACCGNVNRRVFLADCGMGFTGLALGAMLQRDGILRADSGAVWSPPDGKPHFAPKAKRVIYLVMSGGPSQIDLFDYKPRLKELNGTELPGSVRMGQRITGMTSKQKAFPCAAPQFKFSQHGNSGAWLSELLPHAAAPRARTDVRTRARVVRSMGPRGGSFDMRFIGRPHRLRGAGAPRRSGGRSARRSGAVHARMRRRRWSDPPGPPARGGHRPG